VTESRRLVSTLMALHRDGKLEYRGIDEQGRYRLTVAGRPRLYDAAGAFAYLRGRGLGEQAGRPRPPRGAKARELDAYREVLVNPTLPDALRTQLRNAMHAAGLGPDRLAGRAGRNRQAVRNALRWGPGTLTPQMAEQLAHGCGCRWEVYAVRDDSPPGAGPLTRGALLTGPFGRDGLTPVPEAPGITLLRQLAKAHAGGILEHVRPVDPNEAFRARSFRLTLAGVEHRVHVDVVDAWLAGVADGRAATATLAD
jgi:hypothetical protein